MEVGRLQSVMAFRRTTEANVGLLMYNTNEDYYSLERGIIKYNI